MIYVLKPYESVGPFRFGMMRAAVRAMISRPVDSLRRGDGDVSEMDVFDDLGIHVYYDSQDQCEAVEISAPGDVLISGVSTIGRSFSGVLEEIRIVDREIKEDETGFISYEMGFGVYAPFARKNPDLSTESVIAFRRGYYD